MARLRPLRPSAGASPIANMLWPSSVVLARWLVAHGRQLQLRAPRALELGAGLGLAGLAAGRYAANVLLTDMDPRVAANLDSAVRLNLTPGGLLADRGRDAAPRSRQLDWNDAAAVREVAGGDEGWSLVLGADIIHERHHAAGVLAALGALLCRSGVAVLVNPVSRSRAGVDEFRALLRGQEAQQGGLRMVTRAICSARPHDSSLLGSGDGEAPGQVPDSLLLSAPPGLAAVGFPPGVTSGNSGNSLALDAMLTEGLDEELAAVGLDLYLIWRHSAAG